MKKLAPPALKYLYDLTIKDRSPAFVQVNQDGQIQDWGGSLDLYGFNNLKKNDYAGDHILILDGFFPFEEKEIKLSCIETETKVPADIHIFFADDKYWILFLDATQEENRQQSFQQKANELSLLKDKHTKILDQYLGKEISERLLDLNLHESGESRYVSVLFADICGFTSYSEYHSPEQVFHILNIYFESMIKPIFDQKGLIDKIIGDAVMAIFGIVPSDTPSSVQAVNAGFQIIKSVSRLNEIRKKENQDIFDVSIGIASGQVFLGIMGTRERRTLSAIGHHVNMASRLESNARSGEILIDSNTFQDIGAIQNRFSKFSINIKGISEKVDIFSCKVDDLKS